MVFLPTSVIPNVNGGPINCKACTDTSVITSVCCFVCTAVIISDPVPIRNSPAVFVGRAFHSVRLSCDAKRISSGSCVPLAVSLSQPKAKTCLSLSETITFLAIVGALVDPANVVISTALVDVPPDLSQ